MTSLEEVRQTLTEAFQTIHEANYPNVPVNYPNFKVVDIEHQKTPFVEFEILFDDVVQGELGQNELFVRGSITPIFYYQEGRGGQGYLEYTDMLNEHIGMQTINDVHYGAVLPMRVTTFPNWRGSMNMIRFQVVKGLEC